MKRFLNFLISKALLTNIILAMVVTLVLIWVGLNYLNNYTRHGEKIPVPNVMGMRIDLAQKEIEDQNLQWVITDSVYSENHEPMAVVDQQPRPDSNFVKTDRKIYLTVNSLDIPQVTIPDIVGKSLRNARTILSIKGFNIGTIKTEEFDELKPGDTQVIAQFYKGRMIDSVRVDKGSVIDLKVNIPPPVDEEEGEEGEE